MWRILVVLVSVVISVTACGSESNDDEVAEQTEGLGPLGPRNAPIAAAIGSDVLVVGGNQFFCGPTEDCAWPEVPPLTDGAIVDTTTFEWTPIAPAPFGIDQAEAVVIDDGVFVLSQCEVHASCPGGRSFLRYDVTNDAWSELAPIPGNGFHDLVVADDQIFAISTSDEVPVPDFLYKEVANNWVALANAPLPPTFDRFGVYVDGAIVVYGTPMDDDSRAKHVASFDVEMQRWEALDRSPSGGWQVFDVDDTVVLNPHFGLGEGGFHDVATDSWTALPDEPDVESWSGDIVGVIGDRTAQYAYPQGWMLDLRTQSWVEVPYDGKVISEATVVTVGNSMVVIGGHHWTDGEQRVDGGVTLWFPPG